MVAPFSPISQGVEVEAGERMIYVAGQVGARPDGIVPESMEDQTEQTFLNIQTVLQERGMDLEDLVETRTYVTSKDHIPGYRAGRAKVLGTGDDAPRTAAALVVVAGLAQDHWKVEICAVAAKK
ncbi:MAG: enamine deaminase RidA [Alphaproteobacteria bacterium]|nr:enamine deaminase RidA [Alphaproteobacteria bacterium]|tara:strand:+ start:806 stop:1177 length:372 start_codon:yes stop_codon:yes gene_type:complete